MNMQALDWAIVAVVLLVLAWGAYSTKRHTRSVQKVPANPCPGFYCDHFTVKVYALVQESKEDERRTSSIGIVGLAGEIFLKRS